MLVFAWWYIIFVVESAEELEREIKSEDSNDIADDEERVSCLVWRCILGDSCMLFHCCPRHLFEGLVMSKTRDKLRPVTLYLSKPECLRGSMEPCSWSTSVPLQQ
jgi:hypothetical protein